ncbi:MAG: archease [Candidatus Obscuribacterales bacterium]|nr:archease [Candidatus Obscuribacterales bacterium]
MGESIDKSQIRVLDHTADMGFEVNGDSLQAVFELCANALTSILTDLTAITAEQTTPVQLEAADIDGLMYAWLSEILYLFDGEKMLFTSFKCSSLNLSETSCSLTAELGGEQYDPEKHRISTYVKAITFHQMRIVDQPPNCSARVFIDI